IWNKLIPSMAICRKRNVDGTETDINMGDAVKRYELSVGNIVNVVHYAGIKALEEMERKKLEPRVVQVFAKAVAARCEDDGPVTDTLVEDTTEPQLTFYLSDVLNGIRKELIKEGKPFAE